MIRVDYDDLSALGYASVPWDDIEDAARLKMDILATDPELLERHRVAVKLYSRTPWGREVRRAAVRRYQATEWGRAAKLKAQRACYRRARERDPDALAARARARRAEKAEARRLAGIGPGKAGPKIGSVAGERNPAARLTGVQVAEIRRALDAAKAGARGALVRELREQARRFRVSEATVKAIRSGRLWKEAA